MTPNEVMSYAWEKNVTRKEIAIELNKSEEAIDRLVSDEYPDQDELRRIMMAIGKVRSKKLQSESSHLLDDSSTIDADSLRAMPFGKVCDLFSTCKG